MATRLSRIATLGRPLLLGIWCTSFAMGCDTATPGANSEPQPDASPSLTVEATTDEPALQEPIPQETRTQQATNQAITNRTEPLDLSRSATLERSDDSTDIGAREPDNLLPDLFADQSTKTGAKASGRLLMNPDEKASLQAIEGVELKLEVPTN